MGKASHERREYEYMPPAGPLFEQEPEGAHVDGSHAVEADIRAQSPEVVEPPVPLDEVEAAIARRQAEYDELKARLGASNWPPGRIQQRLDAEFPDLRTPKQEEELQKKTGATTRKKARETARPARKTSVRYISPRDKGAPPDIAKEIRGY